MPFNYSETKVLKQADSLPLKVVYENFACERKKEMLSRICITQNNGLLKNNYKLENHYNKASNSTTSNYAILR